jgi:hypothetical protein
MFLQYVYVFRIILRMEESQTHGPVLIPGIHTYSSIVYLAASSTKNCIFIIK